MEGVAPGRGIIPSNRAPVNGAVHIRRQPIPKFGASRLLRPTTGHLSEATLRHDWTPRMVNRLTRLPRTRDAAPHSVPLPLPEQTDLVVVDTTWGEIQPLQPFSEVQTVGELELTRLVQGGAAVIDTRVRGLRAGVTLPNAASIPHDQIRDRMAELDKDRISILFCNGPQCPQTPDAIAILLDAGYPPSSFAYYRGGVHDWVTLAFPTEPA